MKKVLLAGVAAVGLTFAATGAQAALLEVVGGGVLTTPADGGGTIGNQVIPGIQGFVDGALWATQAVKLTYEYVGYEAGYTNVFNVDGSAAFTNNSTPTGTQVMTTSGAGKIDFSFLVGVSPNVLFENGDTTTGQVISIFLGSVDNPGFNRDGNVFYIALDDSGANVDDNHDDLVVKVTATALTTVPEPASLALFGAGLLGLGLARRARRKAV